jgi:hypothetical protein
MRWILQLVRQFRNWRMNRRVNRKWVKLYKEFEKAGVYEMIEQKFPNGDVFHYNRSKGGHDDAA